MAAPMVLIGEKQTDWQHPPLVALWAILRVWY